MSDLCLGRLEKWHTGGTPTLRDTLDREVCHGSLHEAPVRRRHAAASTSRIDAHLNVRSDPPEGLILHASGPVEGGWAMFDVWESHDAFERFAASRALPAGLDTRPARDRGVHGAEVVQPDRMLAAILR